MPSHNFIDLRGLRYGHLQVLARAAETGPHGEVKWCCLCACGTEIVATGYKLRNGRTKSCGCLKHRTGVECPNTDPRPILDRLAEHSHVVLATGCKIWNGSRTPFGHGVISVFGEGTLVHRAAWEAGKGSIPESIDCLHDCPGGDNPACWNVDHLWLGTQADNNADRDRKGRHVALKGEQHGGAILTTQQVLAIRADDRLNYVIGAEYGVSGGQVGRIKSRDAWGHIP